MITIFKNIKKLIQVRTNNVKIISGKNMKTLPYIDNAYLITEDDIILDYGKMDDLNNLNADKIIDATGKFVLPTFCDSHTHIVFAGNRSKEFTDRINGLSYSEIAKRGGGILNSTKLIEETSEKDLYNQSMNRIKNVVKSGTGAIEIKSGYGLTVESELKMLNVIKKIKNNSGIEVKSTFLGAHAFPLKYKNNNDGYVDLIIDNMLPLFIEKKLIDFIDVFCENGYFNLNQTERILIAAIKYNLPAKLHVNQFNSIGAIELATKYNALSVDHLEVMKDSDYVFLKNSKTIPVALPICSFYLGIDYTPARKLIDNDLPLALATDFNPGSAPSGNMGFAISLACIKLKLTPEEAINSATINGAHAMGISKTHGSITVGKKANFILTNSINELSELPYYLFENQIDSVFINGKIN
jgi:imidazolonepropionase